MNKELFIKRLSDGKLFASAFCTFFSKFRQVLIEIPSSREFVLNEGEFELIYVELHSFVKSYEENIELSDRHHSCRKRLEKEFESQNIPEPSDWDSEKYKNWNEAFFQYIKAGLELEGFTDVNGFCYQ